MHVVRLRLAAPRDALGALRDFYRETLGIAPAPGLGAAFAAGASTLEFGEDDGAPFYHFALLVPGDRFEAARRWAAARLPLLPGGDLDGVVWEFSNWDALACYFHDPAGNIV